MSTAYVGALATGLALTEDERELIIQRRIKNVYREVPSIPQGYEFVDFRCTQSGDLFISASYGDRVLEHTQPDFTPRIIVRRKPEVKVKVVKFVPVIEDGVHAYRPLNHGEGFVLSDKGAGTFKGSASVVSYYVYRFVEEEVLASSLT